VPIVLNTSFNNNAEPIVDSVDDAVVTFLTTGIHTLIAGDWRVRKVEGVASHPGFRRLVPSLAPSAKLVRRTRADGTTVGFIERTASRLLVDPSVELSPELFHLLWESQGGSVEHEIDRCGFTDQNERLCAELFELWCARAIRLQPGSAG
jgi:carbamoyltransferase